MYLVRSVVVAIAAMGALFCADSAGAVGAVNVQKATLVFAVGGLGDGSFNDQAWDGLQQAASDFGISVSYIEPATAGGRDAALTAAANSDADLVIATGTMFSNLITDLAESHTTQSFVCIDYAGEGTLPANLAGLTFREHEGAFLVGMIAALESGTHKIGFVGATPIPLIKRFAAGYTQGATHADPAVDVALRYAALTDAGFDDPAMGRQLAGELINGGADVLFHASGSTGLGVFEVAEDRGVKAIGVDRDQSALAAPGVIIASMLKEEGQLIYQVVEKTRAGQFPAGRQSYGLAEGILDYVCDQSVVGQATKDQVDTAKAAIIAGTIVVNPTLAGETAAAGWELYN